jgi:hypothetical protein
LGQASGDLLHFRVRLSRRDSGLKTTYRLIYAKASVLAIEVTITQPPQVTLKGKAKVGRHHSHNSQTISIYSKLTAHDCWIAAESSLPQAITQEDCVRV